MPVRDDMTGRGHARVREIFLAAAARDPSERGAFLDRACAGDPSLREELESLLACDSEGGGFLEEPALGDGFSVRPASGTGRAPLPERIGGYRILAVLAEGGMGIVYRAEQDRPRRAVALKVLRPGCSTPELLRRFEYEGQVLGRLHHPGIAQVYEAGTAEAGCGPQPFLAMELIRGRSLLDHCRARGLGPRERVRLLIEVCEAVQHAHQKGVIHRDLKPANILVDDTGRPKVVDFGVARAEDLRATLETCAGRIIGTLAYMSPEQLRGDPDEVDAASDVHALGVIAWEVLSGRLPYDLEGKSLPEAARAILEAEVPRLGSLDRTLRGDLESIVAKAMEREKGRRYRTAADLAGDLGRFLSDEPVLARPAGTLYQLGRFARRNRVLVGAASAALIALVLGAAVAWVGLLSALRAKDELREARNAAQAAERSAQATAKEAKAEEEKRRWIRDTLLKKLLSPSWLARGQGPAFAEMLAEAAGRLAETFEGHPEEHAAVARHFGLIYRDREQYQDAERHLANALDLHHQCRGPRHRDTLQSMMDLAGLYQRMEKWEKAESWALDAKGEHRAALGDSDPQTREAERLYDEIRKARPREGAGGPLKGAGTTQDGEKR